MWPFTRKEKETYTQRIKYVDWDKVKTTEDVVIILKSLSITDKIKVTESAWTVHGIDKLLTDDVYIFDSRDYSVTLENKKDNT